MNQILLTDNDNSKKKNTNKNINKNSSNDIKKIIVFFSVVILVFGVAIGGVYGYKIIKNSKEKEIKISKPTLTLPELEEGAEEIIVIAESEVGISKIIYTWNDEEDVLVKELNGRKKQEEIVEIPFGENTLKIKVIDQNGQETETVKELVREGQEEKPIITIDETIGNGKVKIIATDENNKIKYITYKWNDEEETTVEAQNEEDNTLEAIVDVKRGKNTLTITAVNSNGKEETIQKMLNGVNNPIIKVTKREDKVYMTITHDMGFKKIEFEINGKKYNYDENISDYDTEKQEIELYFNLIEGENTVIIKAISNETIETEEGIKNTETIYRGKNNYILE